jgi:hypothetical protein
VAGTFGLDDASIEAELMPVDVHMQSKATLIDVS